MFSFWVWVRTSNFIVKPNSNFKTEPSYKTLNLTVPIHHRIEWIEPQNFEPYWSIQTVLSKLTIFRFDSGLFFKLQVFFSFAKIWDLRGFTVCTSSQVINQQNVLVLERSWTIPERWRSWAFYLAWTCRKLTMTHLLWRWTPQADPPPHPRNLPPLPHLLKTPTSPLSRDR